MIYVSSDLHGCDPKDFRQLLELAGFGEEDYLFVLGDVIDRGEHGAELLLWLTQQPNIQLILGNHEALMLACSFLFEEVTEQNLDALSLQNIRLVQNWVDNGGAPTLKGLQRLLNQDPEVVWGILDYLRDAPLYETLDVDGKTFILVHSGLGNYHPDRPLASYSPEELLLERPPRRPNTAPTAMLFLAIPLPICLQSSSAAAPSERKPGPASTPAPLSDTRPCSCVWRTCRNSTCPKVQTSEEPYPYFHWEVQNGFS